ncbi:PEPxxWA-CTERM sorting domain-containing protein [Sphingomonas endophytica]|uniref:Ice-binding protein C-terminal domain-containing protein n=1 Tax=Sphingomonas endophytica TaxID=869719 RepID=A0A147I263_9SPHN|nr:PEPxxWA-CTERM sorting domain-containing protein [Sphingomonas endophytica]KTT71870.1 hypothetical protein NS334_09820 [Sphingomonas endophytica]
MMKSVFVVSAAVVSLATSAPALAEAPNTYVGVQAGVIHGDTNNQYAVTRNDATVSVTQNYKPVSSDNSARARLETPVVSAGAGAASAYVDLAQGKMGAYASAPQLPPEEMGQLNLTSTASASFKERLLFTAAGATYKTLTKIDYEVTLHGVFSGTGGWGLDGALGKADQYGSQFAVGGTSMADGAVSWRKGGATYTALSATEGVFRGSASFWGESWNPLFELQLDLHAYSMNPDTLASGLADMGNTATIKFSLPGNVTMTSASGQFLTGGAAAGVPEPATWAMMLLGFGAVGVAVRRRRAAPLIA